MAFDPTAFLQRFGFSVEADGGSMLKVSGNGNCVFLYGWNIESVRLWYSVFLVECLDIELFYVSVCKARSVLGPTAPTPPAPPAETAPPAELPPASGLPPAGGIVAATPILEDEWVVTYNKKSTTTTCAFGSSDNITHTDLQNLFNTKMGVQLPPPPQPN